MEMGTISSMVYESLHMDEDFRDELVDSLEDTGSLQAPSINAYDDESIKDYVDERIDESLSKKSLNLQEAIDSYEALLKKDIPPTEAKALVLGTSHESVKESLRKLEEEKNMTKKERLEKEKKDYMKSVCEEFRKSAKFSLDEELTEEKLKYENWRIKSLAVRKGIPSSDIREALLKG